LHVILLNEVAVIILQQTKWTHKNGAMPVCLFHIWQSLIAGERTLCWTLRAVSYVMPRCAALFEPVEL